jgi:hypothetical protein
MPSPSFKIDQPSGAGSGTSGLSRKDLWVNKACTLTCTSPPAGATFLWELLYGPPGSTAVIINPNNVAATFTPDKLTQSFRLRLTINAGGPGNVFIFIIACTFDTTGIAANRSWRTPAVNEQETEGNFVGNPNGYSPDYDQIIFDLLANAFGGSGQGWVRKTANYTGQAGDGTVLADTTGGPWTYTFPTGPTDGQTVNLKLKGAGTHSLTLQANGGGQAFENPFNLDSYSSGGGLQAISIACSLSFKWGQTEGTWLVI